MLTASGHSLYYYTFLNEKTQLVNTYSSGYKYYADLYASASGDYCDRWNQMQVSLSNITVKYYK